MHFISWPTSWHLASWSSSHVSWATWTVSWTSVWAISWGWSHWWTSHWRHSTIVVLAAIYVAVSLFNRAYPGRIPDTTLRVLLGLSAVLLVAVPAMLAILNRLPGSNGSIVAYVLAIIGLVAFAYEPVGFIIAVVLGSAAAVMSGVALQQDDPATTLPNLLNVTTTAVLAVAIGYFIFPKGAVISAETDMTDPEGKPSSDESDPSGDS